MKRRSYQQAKQNIYVDIRRSFSQCLTSSQRKTKQKQKKNQKKSVQVRERERR